MTDSAEKTKASGGTALLIVDMISCWDFPDAERLVPGAERITPHIAALAARCRKAGAPVIYANDNQGQWRSDFRALIEQSIGCGGAGARITKALRPAEDDYFVLKPKHSAFMMTPLELLLRNLQVHRLLIAGVASDQCVLVSACEARMRDLDVVVPRDCVASQTEARNRAVLRQFEEVHGLSTGPGPRLRIVSAESGT